MSPSARKGRRNASFRLLDLPLELRREIYCHHLQVHRTIDLHPQNNADIVPALKLLLTCRQVHEEASQVFYALHTFRVFPIHGRFFRRRNVLLSRLTPRCRSVMTSLELRLGPGWAAPPKSWAVHPRMGLPDAISVRELILFIECDPAHEVFNGFRRGNDFYTLFCVDLLRKILSGLPFVDTIHFDAWPSVSRDGQLVSKLALEAKTAGKRITWASSLEIT